MPSSSSACATVKRQRTILGVVMREVQRKRNAEQAAAACSRPTVLLLNACPYLATVFLLRRPPSLFCGGDNYSDAGGIYHGLLRTCHSHSIVAGGLLLTS